MVIGLTFTAHSQYDQPEDGPLPHMHRRASWGHCCTRSWSSNYWLFHKKINADDAVDSVVSGEEKDGSGGTHINGYKRDSTGVHATVEAR